MTEAKSTQPVNLPVTVHGSDGPCERCSYPCECWFTNSHLWSQVNESETGLLCLRCFVEQAEAMGLKSFAWRLVLDAPSPENTGSAQPQLPPRPQVQGGDYRPHYRQRETDVFIAALEARLEAAQNGYRELNEITTDAINRKEKLEAENESLKAQLAEWLKQNGPGGWIDNLRKERVKMLEVIREYRKDGRHEGCYDFRTWTFKSMDSRGGDHRCPTCVKADDLLPKEKP